MPISTQRQLQRLSSEGTSTTKKYGCGSGLFVKHHPNGSIYFIGKMNVKIDGKRKSSEVHIGKFGSASGGEYSLTAATDKWMTIKSWSKNNNKLPSNYYKIVERQRVVIDKTFKNAVDGFLLLKRTGKASVKEVTHKEYTYKLHQLMQLIHPDTPLDDLWWDRGGRERVMSVINQIEDGSKFDLGHRCRKLLSQTFDYAISQGWIPKDQNPAVRLSIERNVHESSHHPCLEWSQVPELLSSINLNKANAQLQAVLATKFLLLTFLRAGTLTRLQWDWIDEDKNMFIIPGSTSGLKRKRGKNEHLPHHLPITSQMRSLLDRLQKLNGSNKYVFCPLRESRYPHLDPSTPNNFLRNLGYRDVCRAHGWRRTALTVGIDVLKADKEVIRKQMGHLPEGKVLKAYDGSLLLDERRKFLDQWNALLIETGLEV